MAKLRVTCPECDTEIALGEVAAERPKVRCPSCEAIFPTPGRARAAGPRRFKAKKKSGSGGGTVAVIAVAGVLLTAGLAVGGFLLVKSKSKARDVVPAAGIGTNVGQLAKEIAGEDIDGVKFKLSDYRGKVVLLDFWGHW